jgi:hypothetical protein
MSGGAAIRAGRLVAGGAALLSGAVLADSAMEHYRGSFENKAMVVPLAVSALALGNDGAAAAGALSRAVAPGVSLHAAGALTGAAGAGFHVYNVTRQVGGFRWGTLFYQAPLGAPAALVLAGALGPREKRWRAARAIWDRCRCSRAAPSPGSARSASPARRPKRRCFTSAGPTTTLRCGLR